MEKSIFLAFRVYDFDNICYENTWILSIGNQLHFIFIVHFFQYYSDLDNL